MVMDVMRNSLETYIFCPPVHHIITLSIMNSQFPQSWKNSKVIPLHKKEDVLEKKNYRPVAILSPVSKVIEKIVFDEIYTYFTNNKLFHPSLHGYRKHKSTQAALFTNVQQMDIGSI